jgi:hypothetical protein
MDTNKDGVVTADELRNLLTGLGEEVTDDVINDMIGVADANGDGKLDFEEEKARHNSVSLTAGDKRLKGVQGWRRMSHLLNEIDSACFETSLIHIDHQNKMLVFPFSNFILITTFVISHGSLVPVQNILVFHTKNEFKLCKDDLQGDFMISKDKQLVIPKFNIFMNLELDESEYIQTDLGKSGYKNVKGNGDDDSFLLVNVSLNKEFLHSFTA